MDSSLLGWLVLLGLGFPLLGVILGELATHLERCQHPLAVPIRYTRNYLLPLLGVLLVIQQLLKLPAMGLSQILKTLTLFALMVSGTALVNGLFTPRSSHQKGQIQVPNLFFQVLRVSVILSILYYTITDVWTIDLSGLVAALGVGSVVIALALQDTLSNLVSGLLLLIAKPFKMGDWIDFDPVEGGRLIEGRVIDQNWWSVTLTNPMGSLINVPNGTLSQATIHNLGQAAVWKSISIRFSYEDPPNRVIPVLNSLVEGIENIESRGWAGVTGYDDAGIQYEMRYQVLPEKAEGVYHLLMSRIYYSAQRHHLTICSFHSKVKDVKTTSSEILLILQGLPYFTSLELPTLEQVARQSRLAPYGSGEVIVKEDSPDEGLYIVKSGQLRSLVTNSQGDYQEVSQLRVGDIFGETAIFQGEVSLVTVIAKEDVEVMIIPVELVIQLIQTKPKFSREMIQLIENGKKRASQVKARAEVGKGEG